MTATTHRRPPLRQPDGITIAGVAVPAAAAAVALVWWAHSGASIWLSHDHAPAAPAGYLVAVYAGGWLLMVTAMMLPTLSPLLIGVGRLGVRSRTLQLCTIAGYGLVWLGVGLAMRLGDLVLHQLMDASPLASRPRVVGGGLLLMGAALQCSPVVRHAADRCRSPAATVMRHWRGRNPLLEAFDIGLVYGTDCARCCAGLTGVMFAVGMTHPLWMALLGAAMAILKTRRLGPVVLDASTMLMAVGSVVLLLSA